MVPRVAGLEEVHHKWLMTYLSCRPWRVLLYQQLQSGCSHGIKPVNNVLRDDKEERNKGGYSDLETKKLRAIWPWVKIWIQNPHQRRESHRYFNTVSGGKLGEDILGRHSGVPTITGSADLARGKTTEASRRFLLQRYTSLASTSQDNLENGPQQQLRDLGIFHGFL